MTIENAQGSVESTQSNGQTINLPVGNNDVSTFFQKYSNDPVKLMDGYRNMQSRYDKAQEYFPASEYAIPNGYEIPDSTKQVVLTNARDLELSAKQFNKLLQQASQEYKKIQEKSEQSRSLRSVVLGGNEGEEALKSFLTDKMPASAIDKIFKEGTIEILQDLKNFKDKSMTTGMNLNSEVGNPSQTNVSDFYEIKSKYFKVADEYDKASKRLGPSHPEVKKIGLQQEELYKIYESHVHNMEKHANRGFTSEY